MGELWAGIAITSINGTLRSKSAELRSKSDQLLALITQEAGDAKSSASLADTSAQQAETASLSALSLADTAHKEADSVHREVGAAEGQLTQLKSEAEKTKADLINLAICNAPRVITNWFLGNAKSYVDPLRPMAGQVVFIEYVPDAEARRAELSIERTLSDAQWNIQRPVTVVGDLADGVSLQPSEPTSEQVRKQVANWPLHRKASDATDELLKFILIQLASAERGHSYQRQERLTPGAIRIQVGLYPPAVYVSPPAEKESASLREKNRQEEEKADVEETRTLEAEWAKLSPEYRKFFEQRHAEWEETKKKNREQQRPMPSLESAFLIGRYPLWTRNGNMSIRV